MFLFFLSLVDIGPIEKCLTELKTPNILPGEREDIKGQVRNTVIDSSEDFYIMKKNVGWYSTVPVSVQC